ncbi:MAG: small, acid-soluble spore protein, alpha/beta type [Clostridiales bacterium]|nr:small, acid-soluble spore protein, alpha/beta type [Clostridiales bacterium]MDY2729023.1 small, acid-soluble spore protein, alpha/beta type [Clostridium sp.]
MIYVNKSIKQKSKKKLTKEELEREKMKFEIAEELGLMDKVKDLGWGGLTASETGRIGGIMNKRRKKKD